MASTKRPKAKLASTGKSGKPAAKRSAKAKPGRSAKGSAKTKPVASAKVASARAVKIPVKIVSAKAAGARSPAGAAKSKAPFHSPLALRVAAMLGVEVEAALERAVHELAERLGLHKLEAPSAEAHAAWASASSSSASASSAASAGSGGAHKSAASTASGAAQAAGHRAAKSAGEEPEEKSSAGKTIPANPLDLTPLPARTVSASSPAQAYSPSSLPKRLYLALDGRGLDGSGMPLEVIDLPCTLGSSRRNTIWINSPRIETHHAQIVETPEGWVLEDLGSEHGTLFEGERISRRVLENGDLFLLAGYLRLRAELR